MKCSHPENKGNSCLLVNCPRAYYPCDFTQITEDENYLCSYRIETGEK